MTANLEQIAKQVSLLNRLVELLRMQEEPIPLAKEIMIAAGWRKRNPWSPQDLCNDLAPNEDYLNPLEAWNHPITQKAWSDELVKVARDYFEFLKPYLSIADEEVEPFLIQEYKTYSLKGLLHLLRKNNWGDYSNPSILEAILNKYERSLSE